MARALKPAMKELITTKLSPLSTSRWTTFQGFLSTMPKAASDRPFPTALSSLHWSYYLRMLFDTVNAQFSKSFPIEGPAERFQEADRLQADNGAYFYFFRGNRYINGSEEVEYRLFVNGAFHYSTDV